MKYPINKEFFPYSRMTPPIQNAKMAGWMGSIMKPPRWVRKNRDHGVSIKKETIKSYDGAEIEILIFDPYGIEEPTPCLVYYHGGGFFFGGAGYHYKLAKQYALKTPCKVIFAQYRLAPKNLHPTPAEDCYTALRWTFENADKLNVDKTKIAVGGDSAEARKSMLDAYPSLRNMYDENDGNTQVFYFKNATATFSAFGKESETVEF